MYHVHLCKILAIHTAVVEIFQSEPKWQNNRLTLAQNQRRNDILIPNWTVEQMFMHLYLYLSIYHPLHLLPSFIPHPTHLSPSVLALFLRSSMHHVIRESGCGRQISTATGRCALALQAWSLIQWDQRLSTQGPFITMPPSTCQRQDVRPAGRAGEGLVPVIVEELRPFTRSCNYLIFRRISLLAPKTKRVQQKHANLNGNSSSSYLPSFLFPAVFHSLNNTLQVKLWLTLTSGVLVDVHARWLVNHGGSIIYRTQSKHKITLKVV